MISGQPLREKRTQMNPQFFAVTQGIPQRGQLALSGLTDIQRRRSQL